MINAFRCGALLCFYYLATAISYAQSANDAVDLPVPTLKPKSEAPAPVEPEISSDPIPIRSIPAPQTGLVNTDLPPGQVKYVRFELALQMCREADDIQACIDRKTGQKSRSVIMPTGPQGESLPDTRNGVSINGVFKACSIRLIDGEKREICHTQ